MANDDNTAATPETGTAPPGAMDNVKGLFANPKSRIVIIVFMAAGVLIMGFTYLRLTKPSTPVPATAKINQPPLPGQGESQDIAISPRQKELIRTDDAKNVNDALLTGARSALPRIAGLTSQEDMDREAKEKDAMGKRVPEKSVATTQPVLLAQAPAAPGQQSQGYQNAQRILSKIVDDQFGSSGGTREHIVIRAPESQNTGANPSIPQNPQTPGPNTAQQGPRIVQAGELFFATVDFAVNSDQSGDILATVHSGRLKGTRLIGQKTLEREVLVLKFTTAAFPDGKTLPINAYAINISDASIVGTAGIASGVDRHYFERYVLPGAAAFVKGWADAVSRSSTTVTTSAVGTTAVQGPLTSNDQMKVAAGEAAKVVGQDLQQQGANRKPTVYINPNTEVGIFFTTDLFDKAQTAAAPAAAPVPIR
jgi:type IV secretory pathway VirB10-like protein